MTTWSPGCCTRAPSAMACSTKPVHVVGVQVEVEARRAVGDALHLEVRVAVAGDERRELVALAACGREPAAGDRPPERRVDVVCAAGRSRKAVIHVNPAMRVSLGLARSRSPIGRGRRLKTAPVWVRAPPGARSPSHTGVVILAAPDPALDPWFARELLRLQHDAYRAEAELVGDDRLPPLQADDVTLPAWRGRYLVSWRGRRARGRDRLARPRRPPRHRPPDGRPRRRTGRASAPRCCRRCSTGPKDVQWSSRPDATTHRVSRCTCGTASRSRETNGCHRASGSPACGAPDGSELAQADRGPRLVEAYLGADAPAVLVDQGDEGVAVELVRVPDGKEIQATGVEPRDGSTSSSRTSSARGCR